MSNDRELHKDLIISATINLFGDKNPYRLDDERKLRKAIGGIDNLVLFDFNEKQQHLLKVFGGPNGKAMFMIYKAQNENH